MLQRCPRQQDIGEEQKGRQGMDQNPVPDQKFVQRGIRQDEKETGNGVTYRCPGAPIRNYAPSDDGHPEALNEIAGT